MEFTIDRETVLEGVQKTLGIVERKTTLPILNNVLVRAERGQIKLMATDREIGLVTRYDADVAVEGDITLSARKFSEMLRELQGEQILFRRQENNQVLITCGKVVYRIPGVPADDFPRVVFDESMRIDPVKSRLLKDMIRKVHFAMSGDDLRKNLNGVFLETEPMAGALRVRMVATDGHRLAKACATVDNPDFLGLEKGVIVPRKGLGEIRKLLEGETGDVGVAVGSGMFLIKTSNTLLKVSLVDAEYPDYRRVIPSEPGRRVQFDRETVLHAFRRMGVMANDRYSGVIIRLSEDRMILNSQNPDVGEASDEIEVKYDGEALEVGYNVHYLIDALEAVEEKEATFDIGVGMKPGVLRPVGNDLYFCIIMPLKL
jgi:DNA polymerase-3 subunit beta